MALEQDVDRLYGLPLDEFTAARNELAKRLRKEGEREQADEVSALAKPSVAAWTVNQLARRRRPAMKRLLDAGEALRKAQEKALGGAGGDTLREAAEREREAVRELRREARSLLEEENRPATDAVLERVATTLSSAAVDPEARELLAAGRLPEEIERSGFDAFAGMAVPAGSITRAKPEPKAKAKAKPAPKAKPSEDGRESRLRAAEERKRAAELRRLASELEREARAAERSAERAARDAERAAQAAERAAEDAAAAQEEADAKRAAADRARAEADAATGS